MLKISSFRWTTENTLPFQIKSRCFTNIWKISISYHCRMHRSERPWFCMQTYLWPLHVCNFRKSCKHFAKSSGTCRKIDEDKWYNFATLYKNKNFPRKPVKMIKTSIFQWDFLRYLSIFSLKFNQWLLCSKRLKHWSRVS